MIEDEEEATGYFFFNIYFFKGLYFTESSSNKLVKSVSDSGKIIYWIASGKIIDEN